MFLKVKDQEYRLRLKCRDFRKLKEKLDTKDLMTTILDAMQNADVDTLAKCMTVMSEQLMDEEAAYTLMDDYLEGDGATVMQLGGKLLQVLDEAGFLPKKGMAASMVAATKKALDKLNIEEIVDQEMDKAEKPFTGYKA
jgi:hypothetical protein